MPSVSITTSVCAHCGDKCIHNEIISMDKTFCCNGCKMVYQLLNKNGLCDYYQLNEKPGINQATTIRKDKFAFLDDVAIAQKLLSFSNSEQTHVAFYLPQMHCSSCLYLLENLHKLNTQIIKSSVNFTTKEVSIIFSNKLSLRTVAELLTSIGYEPYISLQNLNTPAPKIAKGIIYQLGIAGFCFGNIMLLSFPEYLGLSIAENNLQSFFRIITVLLSLPVFFYSAQPFYISAYKGLVNRFLNIDAPISLAVIVTFCRSIYEVFWGNGAGYFDSMSGIVFFMLVGRVLQDKTYQQLSFARDYTSYFPIAVSVLKDKKEIPTALPKIQLNDTLLIHSEELIPADGILTKGKALIDYSFVTGESIPILKEMGEIVYAGGRQKGGNIEILVMKEVSQSYLTSLWAKEEKETGKEDNTSFVHLLSQYFTYIVFGIALITAAYWWIHNPAKIGNAVTAILIIACPCALLLSSTFTNGNVLRILGNNQCYLRSAAVIEKIASIKHIVFDKTGTLTTVQQQRVSFKGQLLSDEDRSAIALLAAQSNHPLNKLLVKHLGITQTHEQGVLGFQETTGKGIEGFVQDVLYAIGSSEFINGIKEKSSQKETTVYVSREGKRIGQYIFHNQYRPRIEQLMHSLKKQYRVSIISGDNDGERAYLTTQLGSDAAILFNQKPKDKINYIEKLQQHAQKVMMIGDGLNDAPALQRSDVGIAIAEDCNNFTPASDVILQAKELPKLGAFIKMCKANKLIIVASFILSITYNIIGLYFAVQGNLSPLVAAILMPSSSLTILLVTFGSSNLVAKWLKLKG